MELWQIKEGASQYLKESGYPVNSDIDGLIGYQVANYEHIDEFPHVGIVIINSDLNEVGIPACWLEPFTGY